MPSLFNERKVFEMSEKNNETNKAMTVVHLQQILAVLAKEAGNDFEVWLSCDEVRK